MSRNKAIILIVSVLLILVIGLAAYYFLIMKKATGGEGGGLTGILDIFPFGNPNETGSGSNPPVDLTIGTSTDQTGTGGETVASAEAFRKVSTEPIGGATIFDKRITITTDGIKETFEKTYIRYVNRGNGHVKEIAADSLNIKTLANTTIPKIYNATWINQSQVVLRFIDEVQEIKSFLGTVDENASTTDGTAPLGGSFLDKNITELAVSPDKTRLFYITTTPEQGILYTLKGGAKSIVMNLPFKEWQIEWPKADTLTITTNASQSVSGYSYTLSTAGTLRKLFGPQTGLLMKSSQGFMYVLKASINETRIQLSIVSTKNDTQIPISFETLPEKCVWGTKNPTMLYCAVPKSLPVAVYPDAWYQGKVSFVDELYSVDAVSGQITKIFDISKSGAVDAVDLSLNEKGTILIFKNKIDNSLWSLDLTSL
jgi:hypothetical protein